ncbi:MAG: hypothetical protein WDO74_23900 [Pseudomonadota bacterium]
MHLPYTDHYSDAVAIAGQVVGVALTAVLWWRSFPTRAATATFTGAIAIAALLPAAIPELPAISSDLTVLPFLQLSASLATLAIFLGQRPPWFKALAVLGQAGLLGLTLYVRESDNELAFLHLFWYGILIGVHLLWLAPPTKRSLEVELPARQSFVVQEVIVFVLTVALAFLVTNLVFERLVYNGDEIANTYQAHVYGHLRAYGSLPPCASMFENYWVYRLDGRAFSQYTPGWPMFMGIFARLGVISLAGPVMAGITAVGIGRLSRRLAADLGPTPESSQRIVAIASVLGPVCALLGPSMLLNGASRFSHTMVCACFAWAIESLCVLSDANNSRVRTWIAGLGLGTSAALILATRPTDGATLGVGLFAYFAWVAYRRRIGGWRGWVGTALGFAAFGGLTLVVLRLQLGAWFQTAYALAPSVHGEAKFILSLPQPNELKFGVPLATGAYCWWPAAPALGIAGLIRALGGRERRVSFMLLVGGSALLGFYYFVQFGRGTDDGLGPRYHLPLVVAMAAGGAALLAPLFAQIPFGKIVAPSAWLWSLLGSLSVAAAMTYGVVRIAPLLYPVAEREYHYSTAPFRGARKIGLKNAIVWIIEGHTTETESNMAQNSPMDPNPDVLYLIRHSKADEQCARKHFPGRTWYRAGKDETLLPY